MRFPLLLLQHQYSLFASSLSVTALTRGDHSFGWCSSYCYCVVAVSFLLHPNSRFKDPTSEDLVPNLNMFPFSKQLLLLTITGLSHHLIGVVVTQSFPQEYRCTFTSDDVRAIVRFHYLAGLSEEETRDSLAQVFRRQTLQRTMIARILQETREGESFNCFHHSLFFFSLN